MDQLLVPTALMAVTVGVVDLGIAGLIAAGQLPRNGLVGIRTRSTRRSDAAWEAGHRAAAPTLRISGVAALVLVALALVMRLPGWEVSAVLSSIAAAVALVGVAVATAQAGRAARDAN